MATKTTTIKHTTLPITDVHQLAGTILDPANAKRTWTWKLPEGLVEDITGLRLPPVLRECKVTDDGTPVLTDLVRAADRVVQAGNAWREDASEENERRYKEAVAVFVRNAYRRLTWRFQDLVNARDSKTTSSAYLVGVPAFRHDIFMDGKASELGPWEVSFHPATARRIGVRSGDLVLLERFPKTCCRVVEVTLDETLGRDVIGLPVVGFERSGKATNLAKELGGDADGDCYTVRAFHKRTCRVELEEVFANQWSGVACPIDQSVPVLSWRDEEPTGFDDEAIAESKFMQKIVVGPITNQAIATFVLKMMVKDRLPLSFAQLRHIMERSIETAMDMKKVQGDDPLCLRSVLLGERELDARARAELAKQGYVVGDIETLVTFIAANGGDLRQLALKNPAYAVMMGERDIVERVLETAQPDIARQLVNSLYAHRFVRPAPKRYHPRLTRPRGRYGRTFFQAAMDQATGEIQVVCGLGEHRVATEAGGRAIRLSPVEVALFRPTVQVEFIQQGRAFKTNCVLHQNWASVINALARSEYAWEIWEIIATPEKGIADRDLERLVRKVLRRTLKAYELEGGDLGSWNAVCGVHKYVVLDTELPLIEGMDFVTLERMRRMHAATFLRDKGLINYMSDTISGDPGMAFYARIGEDLTAATASDPLNALAARKRAPVRNAIANLVDILGAKPESFRTRGKHRPPMCELATVAMPYDGMDAIIVSDAAAADLAAMMPKVDPVTGKHGEFHVLTDGSKIQSRLDAKGVVRMIPEDKMPWLRFADGSMTRAQVAISMTSTSHQMLRHTHATLALTAAARKMVETTGSRMRVPGNVTMERVVRCCRASGLYDTDDLNVEVLHPETLRPIGVYPGGYAAFGVHRQIPEVVASTHECEHVDDYMPTSIKDGGTVSGLAGDFCMLAEGLAHCQGELHGHINSALRAELGALAGAVRRDPRTHTSTPGRGPSAGPGPWSFRGEGDQPSPLTQRQPCSPKRGSALPLHYALERIRDQHAY